MKKETVNHPNHYNASKIEAIAAIEAWKANFNIGNAIKYLSRYKYKHKRRAKQIEDLKKAAWYIAREIENLEKL